VNRDHKAHRASWDLRVNKVNRGYLDKQDPKARKDLKENKGYKESRDLLDHRAFRVRKEYKVFLEQTEATP
jgi:hypothetical protein